MRPQGGLSQLPRYQPRHRQQHLGANDPLPAGTSRPRASGLPDGRKRPSGRAQSCRNSLQLGASTNASVIAEVSEIFTRGVTPERHMTDKPMKWCRKFLQMPADAAAKEATPLI